MNCLLRRKSLETKYCCLHLSRKGRLIYSGTRGETLAPNSLGIRVPRSPAPSGSQPGSRSARTRSAAGVKTTRCREAGGGGWWGHGHLGRLDRHLHPAPPHPPPPTPPPRRDPPSPELQLYSQVSAGLWPGVGGPALRAEAGRGPGFQGIEWLYPVPFLSRESSLHGREGEERPPACSC